MKLFLAGTSSSKEIVEKRKIPYVLESFYYFADWQKDYIKNCEMFLLDSGAFTFISNQSYEIVWEEYVDRYADFINKQKIDYFFELDIDSVVGYERVKELRTRLEKKTGKRSIPVWHKSRGFEEYKKMCDEYDYVAVGGVVIKEIKPRQYKVFPTLINEAHRRGAKVHGLGFTNTGLLSKYHFDSVDSTSWTAGGRFGQVYRFVDGKMMVYQKQEGKRAIRQKVDEHNLDEWIKYQSYARRFF